MANTNAPFGFIPIGHISGGAIPEPHLYNVTASQVIYRGDPVIVTSAGSITVGAAASGVVNLGIAAEYFPDPVQVANGTTPTTMHIYDDPGILYKVQVKTGVTTTLANTIFMTSNIITYAAGSTISLQSAMALDTPGTGTNDFLILGLFPAPNNALGDSAIVIVKYNKSVFTAPYAGI